MRPLASLAFSLLTACSTPPVTTTRTIQTHWPLPPDLLKPCPAPERSGPTIKDYILHGYDLAEALALCDKQLQELRELEQKRLAEQQK